MSDMLTVLKDGAKALKTAPDGDKVELASKLAVVIESLAGSLIEFADIPEQYINEDHKKIEDQIKAIDIRTERAVDQFLSCSERLGTIVKDAPDDIKKAVQNEINAMFEASNFQDLVSQHANEIRLLTEDVKSDMIDLQAVTGGGDGKKPHERTRNRDKRADSHLLNGPPMPTEDE